MKRLLGVLAVLVAAAGIAVAGGEWTTTYAGSSQNHGAFAVENTQSNTAWSVASVLFDLRTGGGIAPVAPVTIVVKRVTTGGGTVVLGTWTETGATSAMWVADTEIPFRFGETLQFSCGLDVCKVELVRRAVQ
jgi:hypothetical protein